MHSVCRIWPKMALSVAGIAALAATSAGEAHAQTSVQDAATRDGISLQARYSVSMAGIPVGHATLHVDVTGDRYVASADGHASWLVGLLLDSQMRAVAQGRIERNGPVPDLFMAQVEGQGRAGQPPIGGDGQALASSLKASDGPVDFDDANLAMAGAMLDMAVVAVETATGAGAGMGLASTAGHSYPVSAGALIGSLAMAPAQLQTKTPERVIDPVSALILPMTGAFDVLTPEICQRETKMSAGTQRYQLTLSFERMERVEGAGTADYSGPAIVCAASLLAEGAGNGDGYLMRHLVSGRGIELWFVPIAGTRLVAPYRAVVSGMPGPLEARATTFTMGSPSAATLVHHPLR